MWAIAINPIAGGGKGADIGREVAGYFSSYGLEYSIISGSKAHLLRSSLDTFLDSHDCEGVIAVGGDGLAHLVLQSVAPRKVPFAIVPAGTGNDLVRSIGWLGYSVKEILDFVTTQSSEPIDLGLVDSEWFGAILSTGFDAVVNERANKLIRPKGPSRYNIAIALELPKFSPIAYSIELDNHSVSTEAMLIAIANGSFYGSGMQVCPNADMHDGLFDVMVLKPISKIEFIKVFPKVYKGEHVDHPAVNFYKSTKVSLIADSVAYADGERIGQLPVKAECIAGAALSWSP